MAAIELHAPCRKYHVFRRDFYQIFNHRASSPPPSLDRIELQPPSSLHAYMRIAMRTSDRMSRVLQTRRSVPGMKDLLPLQLSSPSLPNIEIWPSPNSIQRSTFGFEEPQSPKKVLEGRRSITRHGNPTRLPLSIRPQQYRDSPICYEPGSPLPKSPTESLHFHYSPPSSCDYTMDECSSPNTELDEQYETMSVIKAYQEYAHRDNTSSWASNPTDISRSSGLSFQCMGEPMFPNEAAWLRSPTARWDGSFSRPRPEQLSKSMPDSRNPVSWPSERSFLDDEGDIFAQATIKSLPVAPSKAHVVDVSGRRLSGLSVKIPPRTSSLTGIYPVPMTPDYSNKSWMNLDESPTTPESWETENSVCEMGTSPTGGFRAAPQARRLEMEMLSPATSPSRYQHRRSGSGEPSPGIFPFSLGSHRTEDSQAASKLTPLSTTNIIAALEDWAYDFPNNTLTHNTPCVLSLRQLLQKSKPKLSQGLTPELQPPFDYDSQYFPQDNTQRRRRVTFGSSTPARFMSWSSSPPSSDTTHAACALAQVATPHPPALQALRRVFPGASRSISTLYAYIISYIFTCSLRPSVETSAFANMYDNSSLHRSPSIVSSKAANMLGISFTPLAPTSDGTIVSSGRVSRLAEQLKVCICRLVQVMRNAPDGAEYLDAEFLRSLVEVVRGCEMHSC